MLQAERMANAKFLQQECRQGPRNRKEASVLKQSKEEEWWQREPSQVSDM